MSNDQELIAVGYLRCSGEKQAKKDSSLPGQQREIERQAERDGASIVKWFTDDGISGKFLEARDAMNEMLAYLEKHKGNIDFAYVYDASRMARNRKDAIFIRDECERLKVKLVSVAQPDTDDEATNIMLHGLWDGMAHAQSVKLGKDVKRGLRQALSQGLWPWSDKTPYGYRRTEERNARGALRFRLAVSEEQAPVVRYIFDLYFAGLGFKAIAARLTDEGVAPPSRSDVPKERLADCWRSKHVQRILGGAPIYYGSIDCEGELFPIVDGIVSKETWDRARALAGVRLRKKSTVATFGAGKVSDHGVLRPWLRCAGCEGSIAVVRGGHEGHRHFYYTCRTRQENKAACPGISCRTDMLDDIVLTAIERDVLTAAKVRALIEDTLERMRTDAGGEVVERRAVLDARLKELDRKIRTTAMQVTDGLIEADDAKAMNAPLLVERDAARAELKNLPVPEAVPTIDEIDADAFREDIAQQYRAAEVGIRRTALDRIITEIRLEPGVARLFYAWKDAGSPEPYQEPPGPPNAPKSPRLPSASTRLGSPALTPGLVVDR